MAKSWVAKGSSARGRTSPLGGGSILGLFFVPPEHVQSTAELDRATWLEVQADPAGVRARLLAAGVPELAYKDRTRFYFRAPGDSLFRLAPLGAGI